MIDGEFETIEEEFKACHKLLDKHNVEDMHLDVNKELTLFGRISVLVGDLRFTQDIDDSEDFKDD
jgi:hypothetical protein